MGSDITVRSTVLDDRGSNRDMGVVIDDQNSSEAHLNSHASLWVVLQG